MKNAKVFDIQRYCINDGKGIRTVVFFKGCPLACKWCHNPQGLSSIDDNNVLEYSTNELLNEVLKDKDFYDTSWLCNYGCEYQYTYKFWRIVAGRFYRRYVAFAGNNSK